MNVPFVSHLNRRQALSLLGGAGASAFLSGGMGETARAANSCVALAAAQTEGPYWVEEMLNRSDIRVDPSDGSVRPGATLTLTLNIQEITGSSCDPLSGAHVDIWHCDATGLYSDVAANRTVGKKFLRGYQITGDDGVVQFTTIYPGWYSGRTVHIHVRIRTYSGTQVYDAFTAQIFFDDTLTDQIFQSTAPYSTRGARDTRNTNDMVLTQTRGATVFASLTQTAGGYAGSATIGVNLKTVASAVPSITSGGVVSAASYAAGVAPGSWHAIFGTNLAASTRTLTGADVVNGNLPTSLGGVTVLVNNKPGYISYISSTQVNFQAPEDASAGSVTVAVTNSAGTSPGVSAAMQTYLPAFFAVGNYAVAVLLDGTVINGVSAGVQPGQIIELYGTGFGPTNPAVAPGVIPQAAAPLANDVAITIGGAAAKVSFAGIAAAGLYQFNLVVPALAEGDYEVVASLQSQRTQPGLLLKIRN